MFGADNTAMPFDQLILLATIAISASFTPGPNNALVASFAAHHGFRAALPHVLGVTIGFPVMIFMVGLFLGQVFQQSATLQLTLKVAGAGILLWMAWRTATAGSAGTAAARPPFTFVQSAAFQWVNPKGWTFVIGVTAQFVVAEAPAQSALICAGIFAIAGLASMLSWAVAGHAMTRFLTNARRLQAFNITMGALIALSVVMLFFA